MDSRALSTDFKRNTAYNIFLGLELWTLKILIWTAEIFLNSSWAIYQLVDRQPSTAIESRVKSKPKIFFVVLEGVVDQNEIFEINGHALRWPWGRWPSPWQQVLAWYQLESESNHSNQANSNKIIKELFSKESLDSVKTIGYESFYLKKKSLVMSWKFERIPVLKWMLKSHNCYNLVFQGGFCWNESNSLWLKLIERKHP